MLLKCKDQIDCNTKMVFSPFYINGSFIQKKKTWIQNHENSIQIYILYVEKNYHNIVFFRESIWDKLQIHIWEKTFKNYIKQFFFQQKNINQCVFMYVKLIYIYIYIKRCYELTAFFAIYYVFTNNFII